MESEEKTNVENVQMYYVQKHAAGDLLTIGSLVLKKDFRRKRQKGGKMEYRWQGPYTISLLFWENASTRS